MIKIIVICIIVSFSNTVLYAIAGKINSKDDKASNAVAVATADMSIILTLLIDSGVIG